MIASRLFRAVGGWSAGIAIVLGMSFCSEWPKYRFEQAATEIGARFPGSRLILSLTSIGITSPISWLRPAKTTLNFAIPDPLMEARFVTLTIVYEEDHPIVFLWDADCEDHTAILYGLNEPESAFPAIDAFGEPVVAPNQQIFRQRKGQLPAPPEFLHAFCDTDWTAERDGIRAARLAQ
jgi:hypothetical protein